MVGAKLRDAWDFTRPGDLRALGRYQFDSGGGPLTPSTSGVTFGLKLPTGSTGVSNAEGSVAERSLQPGTGTTDLILGAFYHRKLMEADASWFAQAQYQHAMNSRDGYRPGAQLSADLGYRQGVGERLGLLVQLNLLHKRADQGAQAEPADSGGRFAFLSPGVSYGLSGNLQAYAFYQHPLHAHVRGVQLTPSKALLVGLSGRL